VASTKSIFPKEKRGQDDEKLTRPGDPFRPAKGDYVVPPRRGPEEVVKTP